MFQPVPAAIIRTTTATMIHMARTSALLVSCSAIEQLPCVLEELDCVGAEQFRCQRTDAALREIPLCIQPIKRGVRRYRPAPWRQSANSTSTDGRFLSDAWIGRGKPAFGEC